MLLRSPPSLYNTSPVSDNRITFYIDFVELLIIGNRAIIIYIVHEIAVGYDQRIKNRPSLN